MLDRIKRLNSKNKYHLSILSIELSIFLLFILISLKLLLKLTGIYSVKIAYAPYLFLFSLILSFAYLYHTSNKTETKHQYLIMSSILLMSIVLVVLWK